MNLDSKYFSKGNPEDEIELHKRISKEINGNIVEIGILNGETSKIMLDANPKNNIFGIDPIIPDSMNINLIGDYNKINNLSKRYENFFFINDYSFNVIKNWDKDISYLFIDGDHTYEAVKKDYNDWSPFVINGGYIAFHDSAANRGGPYWWEGSSKFVDELIKTNTLEYIETIFCLTLFKKI